MLSVAPQGGGFIRCNLLDAAAALALGIHGCVASYHRAVWRVLFDDEADGRS